MSGFFADEQNQQEESISQMGLRQFQQQNHRMFNELNSQALLNGQLDDYQPNPRNQILQEQIQLKQQVQEVEWIKKNKRQRQGYKKKYCGSPNSESCEDQQRNQKDDSYYPSDQNNNKPMRTRRRQIKKGNKKVRFMDDKQQKNYLKKVSKDSFRILQRQGILSRQQFLEKLNEQYSPSNKGRIKRRSYDAMNVMSAVNVVYLFKNSQSKHMLYSKASFEGLSEDTQRQIIRIHKKKSKKSAQTKRSLSRNIKNNCIQRSRQKDKPHNSAQKNDKQVCVLLDEIPRRQTPMILTNEEQQVVNQIQGFHEASMDEKKKKLKNKIYQIKKNISLIKKTSQQSRNTLQSLKSLVHENIRQEQNFLGLDLNDNLNEKIVKLPLVYLIGKIQGISTTADSKNSVKLDCKNVIEVGSDLRLINKLNKLKKQEAEKQRERIELDQNFHQMQQEFDIYDFLGQDPRY